MTRFRQPSFFDDDVHGRHDADGVSDGASGALGSWLDELSGESSTETGGSANAASTPDAAPVSESFLDVEPKTSADTGGAAVDSAQATDPHDTEPESDANSTDDDVMPLAEPEAEEPAQVQVTSETDPTPVSADAPQFGGLPDPGQDAVDAFFGPPRLDRPRAQRMPLVPRWVWIAVAASIAAIAVIVGAAIISGRVAGVAAPNLAGIDVDTARVRLAQDRLSLTVSEQRFSPSAAGMVLSQTPAPGSKLKPGDSISVVVSAGSEQFPLPSVVGDGLLLARGLLETRGLEVRVESQPSQQPSDTVLLSNPPAGTSVQTGDIVRLTVAAPGPNVALLLPYDMRGVTVVIDPAPVNDAQQDVTLDVARRLRSLIEASRGVVVATRALADTNTLIEVPARARRAAAATATVAIGLSTVPVGAAGLMIYTPSPVLAFASASAKLSSKIASDLVSEAGAVQSATSTTDTVLAAAQAPWTRLQLGSFSQREDVAKFSDSAWEDSVARALYRAIASSFGKKSPTP